MKNLGAPNDNFLSQNLAKSREPWRKVLPQWQSQVNWAQQLVFALFYLKFSWNIFFMLYFDIRVKEMTRTNIRIYSCQENDTNENPNIFVWTFLTRTNIRIYSCQENGTNEYPNIFVWTFLSRTNIRIYSYYNFDMKKYPNKYSDQKYSNIRIYLFNSGLHWHQFCAFTV